MSFLCQKILIIQREKLDQERGRGGKVDMDNLPVVVAEGGASGGGVGGGKWSLSGRKQKYYGRLPEQSHHERYSACI